VGILQVSCTSSKYLAQTLSIGDSELRRMCDSYAHLPDVPVSTVRSNVEALKGAGRSTSQIKALVQQCPAALAADCGGVVTFLQAYGLSQQVCCALLAFHIYTGLQPLQDDLYSFPAPKICAVRAKTGLELAANASSLRLQTRAQHFLSVLKPCRTQRAGHHCASGIVP
jgi:hypothetical protein